jgi:hypothetical protein
MVDCIVKRMAWLMAPEAASASVISPGRIGSPAAAVACQQAAARATASASPHLMFVTTRVNYER